MASLAAGLCSGCSEKASSTAALPVVRKVAPGMPAPDATGAPAADAPPAPDAAAVSAANSAPTDAAAAPDVPFSGKNDAEKLTWALRSYFQDPNRPGITSLEPLVRDGVIKSIPEAPSGMKFVVDMKMCEVRLEKK